jgi:hypothetical protein
MESFPSTPTPAIAVQHFRSSSFLCFFARLSHLWLARQSSTRNLFGLSRFRSAGVVLTLCSLCAFLFILSCWTLDVLSAKDNESSQETRDEIADASCFSKLTLILLILRSVLKQSFISEVYIGLWYFYITIIIVILDIKLKISYFTPDAQSIGMSSCRFYFLLSFAGQLLCSSSWGALSNERSVICSAICQWPESRRTHNRTSLSHLRILGSLSVASYHSQGLRRKYTLSDEKTGL